VSRILVIDDEASMREVLRILLEKDGHEILLAADGAAGLAIAIAQPLDLIISDVRMPRLDGVGFLAALRERGIATPVVMVTAYASSDSAIQAMKHGAFDYLTKPFKVEEIKLVIRRALEEARASGPEAPAAAPEAPGLRGIIGRSPKMVALYKLISRVSAVDSMVLITGESGTGKELVARTIHYNSPRSDKPFLAINCGALSEELLESELFGHVRGSFTGAVAHKTGLFEAATGGTVFLDEVAEMSPRLQVKLLRFLQDHAVRRVGGTEDIEVDVRIIAATNQDLQQLIQTGAFREDLYYRLNVIALEMPPLRDRREDIPLLAASFLGYYGARAGRPALRLAADAMELLTAYAWPGNVRQLENVIERAAALATSDDLGPANLPPELLAPPSQAAVPPREIPPGGMDLEKAVADFELALMRDALEKAEWIQTRAAELLSLNLRAFRYRAKKYGLDRLIRDRNHGDT
jgi:two-component system response regulator PilR (NtrC family)